MAFLRSWQCYLVLGIVAVVVSGLFDHDVLTPDEPRVMAVIKSMFLSGNLVIPEFAGIPFVEKPPLFFAYAVGLMHLTGLDALMAGRLGLAILCLLTLLATFRFACLLQGRRFGWASVAVLATLEGFLVNFHWLRVDAALAMTSMGAIWAFGEAYLRGRYRWLLVAGVFTGLAFLSKGPVAIVLCIAPIWLLLFMRHLYLLKANLLKTTFERRSAWGRILVWHLVGMALMALVMAAWIYPFYLKASPELWHAWFWDNQVGRLTGASTDTLGHNHDGEPFYYASGVIEYTLPWSGFLIAWLAVTFRELVTLRGRIRWQTALMLGWLVLTMLVLGISVTKRTMYMAPLMPMFALMIADAALRFQGRIATWYRRGWALAMGVSLAVFAVTPLWAQYFPKEASSELMQWLTSWHITAPVIGLALTLMVCVEITRWPGWVKFALITMLFFCSGLNHLMPAVDVAKDMRRELHALAVQIPEAQRTRTASVGFTETMSSIFYLYSDWTVPGVDSARARRILLGQDEEYDYLLLDRYNSTKDPLTWLDLPADTPYRVLAVGHPRSNKKNDAVYWLTAAP
ncbi:glycosyltransferase family 39 protein [Kushneria pakistanensis]|nr:glycosyltransferase family 39 protein [Kushneria pakistanensis]